MRVAEDAKGIILTWSKCLVGLAVVGLALFGVASYESIGTKIDQKIAGQKIEEKIVAEIDKREGKMKAFQEGQQKLYIDSAVTSKQIKLDSDKAILQLKLDSDKALGEIKQAALAARTSIEQHKQDVSKLRSQVSRRLLEGQPRIDDSDASALALFGQLPPGTLGISASVIDGFGAEGRMEDGEFYGTLMYPFVKALGGHSLLKKDTPDLSMEQAFKIAVASGHVSKQKPVLVSSDKSFVLSHIVKSKPGKIIAVLAGVNVYADPTIRLSGSINGVNSVKALFVNQIGTELTNIQTFLDKDATEVAIRKGILNAKGILAENDVFIF